MDKAAYTWSLGPGNWVHVYKEGKIDAAVRAEYDAKLRFSISSSSASNIVDWNQVVLCLAEAKSTLRKIKKL